MNHANSLAHKDIIITRHQHKVAFVLPVFKIVQYAQVNLHALNVLQAIIYLIKIRAIFLAIAIAQTIIMRF